MKLGNQRRDYTSIQRNEWHARDAAAPEEEEYEADTPEELAPEPRPALQAQQPREPVEGPARAEECSSVLGAGSTWQGSFTSEASVRLDGKISGEIRAGGTVHVTEGAEVNAVIHGKYVVIAGAFDGQIFCSERVELRPTSRAKGSITSRLISVGEGAFIDGEIHLVDQLPADTEEKPTTRAESTRNADLTRLLADTEEPHTNGHIEPATPKRR